MTRTTVRSALLLIAGSLLFHCATATAQTQIHSSSVMHFQMYVTPWINSYGQNVGIRVHYSVGSLMDLPGQAAPYAAVCVAPWGSYAPCLEATAKVWTMTTYSPGSWVIQHVPLNCNTSGIKEVQVHQPYVSSWSGLNFSLFGGSPYRQVNGYPQLFYYGSSDTARLQINGCYQAYY
jgi:hypothetical protein